MGEAPTKAHLCIAHTPKATFQRQNGALPLPPRGDRQTTRTFYNLAAITTSDFACLPRFQHRQRLSTAPVLDLTTAYNSHWGEPASSPKRLPQFDHCPKVSPAPKPTNPSRIWQRHLSTHRLTRPTKCSAFRLPLCPQARLCLKAISAHPKPRGSTTPRRALRLAVGKPLAYFASGRLLCQTCAQLAAFKGETRLLANRPVLVCQSALPSSNNAAQPTYGKLLKITLPLKADLTLPLPPSPRLSTRPCFCYPSPNDGVSGTACLPSTIAGAATPPQNRQRCPTA